jgi:hypothetical protein
MVIYKSIIIVNLSCTTDRTALTSITFDRRHILPLDCHALIIAHPLSYPGGYTKGTLGKANDIYLSISR